MLEVIISWIYIGVICTLTGFGAWKLLSKVVRLEKPSFISVMTTGIVCLTVYTEYLSIVYKIALLAQSIIVAAAFAIWIRYRKELLPLFKNMLHRMISWEGFFYLLLTLFFAFFTSRGDFHTDTNIYHAANIRIYEAVGLIKGMTNLQWNFGYNSASLAFAAFFSFGWLLPHPVHVTTGFLELVFGIYACHHLKDWRKHPSHLGDACFIAIWIYILVIITRSMSPATDFAAMLLVMYGIAKWMLALEEKRDVSEYALLSVFMVYVLTVKLSAGCMVLIVLYPLIKLIKEKRFQEILSYFLMGVLVLLPFLIRNYYISGWLIYPFSAIDIFHPDWKVPLATLQRDSSLIKTYGRCLYDPDKIATPFREWISVWWGGQQYYERMLILSDFLAFILLIIHERYRILHGTRQWGKLILYAAICASAVLWFMEAPFIRYGLAFLLVIPLLAAGTCADLNRKGLWRILYGTVALTVFLLFTPYIDNYFQDFGVFVRHNLTSGYYVIQKDYDRTPTDFQMVGKFKMSYPKSGELNSYYAFPGTAYRSRLDEITARGESLRDGFRHQ